MIDLHTATIEQIQHALGSQFYEEIEALAFQILPHVNQYDQDRKLIALGDPDDYNECEYTYDEFHRDLEYYCETENTKGMIEICRTLARIDKGIHLVMDVSDVDDPEWIIKGIIVLNGITFIIADSGVGKTTICIYIDECMRKGNDFFGLPCKKGSVIFVENDESAEMLKSQVKTIDPSKHLNIATCEVIWDANAGKFNPEFEDLLFYYTPDVVVLDSYTSLGVPDITSPSSGLVLDELRRLAKTHHCAFVILHHVNKQGDQLGSNLHRAKADVILTITDSSNDTIVITQDKVRGEKFEPLTLKFNRDTLEIQKASMTLKETVLMLKSQQVSEKEIVERFHGRQRDTVKKYLRTPATLEETKSIIKNKANRSKSI